MASASLGVFGLGLFSVLALAAIWGGYPLVVRALGGLRRRRVRAGTPEATTVSVIIASSDEQGAIRARVANVLETSFPEDRLEVVVALDAVRARCTPAELADIDPRVTVLVGDAAGGKASNLNAAVRAATGEMLVFADTAQRFEATAISELVREFANPRIGAVSGMLELPGAEGKRNLAENYWRYERWLRHWEARVHSCVGVTGAIYAMRRSLWRPLPAGLILDDVYTPMRLVLEGWRIGFTESAVARDTRRFAAGQEYTRKVRTLTGVIQVVAWLPGVMNPLRNTIWLQFVVHKLLRMLTPYFAALMLISGVWIVGRMVMASSIGIPVLASLGAMILLLCLIPNVRGALRAQIAWGVAMQSSIVVATVNGVRGRWNVWT
jgi:cellulose synthase/poly-beta-1,6-N-acetylglucosamine synthase-like glycosyltransferase